MIINLYAQISKIIASVQLLHVTSGVNIFNRLFYLFIAHRKQSLTTNAHVNFWNKTLLDHDDTPTIT